MTKIVNQKNNSCGSFFRPKAALSALIVFSMLSLSARAWWGNGHMIVARIAYDILQPEILDKANQVLKHLAQFTTLERDYPFVECATFADEIKGRGFNDQSNLHFVDTPFFDQGYQIQVQPEMENVTWAIDMIVANMKRRNLQPDNQTKGVSWDFSDSYHLRLLVHYIGDVHQPLHASSRYTSQFPDGDQGGNGYKIYINNQEDITNLHALWDSVVVGQADDMELPLSHSSWEKLGGISLKLRTDHPQDSIFLTTPYHESESAKWAEESFQIVQEEIYSDIHLKSLENGLIVSNDEPSREYLEKSRLIAEKQLVKAGYRLAKVLNDIWSSHQDPHRPKEEVINQEIHESSSDIEQEGQQIEKVTSYTFLQE